MAITNKDDSQIIGAVGIRVVNKTSKIAECGYWLKRELWGQGIATEVTNELIKFGFKNMGMNKIAATAIPENIGSVRVLEKVGMTKEGLLRENIIARGNSYDTVYMSILKREYEQS